MTAKIIPLHRCTEVEGEFGDAPTIKVYARTLHGPQAAFPRDPQYAHAVDGMPSRSQRIADAAVLITCGLSAVAMTVMAVFGWLPKGA